MLVADRTMFTFHYLQGENAKKRHEELEAEFKPLTDWLKESPLKDDIEKATVSQRLVNSPCALSASSYGQCVT